MVTVWASACTCLTPLAISTCSVCPTSTTVLPPTGLLLTCTRLVISLLTLCQTMCVPGCVDTAINIRAFVFMWVLVSSPSCWGDVVVYVKDINQPSLPTPFYSVLVSVFTALSTVFHSTNSPDNSPLSQSVLPVLILPCWSFQLYISLWKSPSALI